jgi:hypothetical protein
VVSDYNGCLSVQWEIQNALLGAFAKLRKASINYVMSVRLPLWNNPASTGRTLMKFKLSSKSVEKIDVSLKSDKNNGYFTRRRFHIYDNISLNVSLNEKYFG